MFRPPSHAPAWRAFTRVALFAGSAAIGLAGLGSTGSAAAAPAPMKIAGDRQSAEVAELAESALDAQSVWLETGSPEHEEAYVEALEETAHATAREFGVIRAEMSAAWTETDLEHQTAVLTALTQLGAPYRRYTSDPEVGFDCSGLTTYAWNAAGHEIPRSSGDQIAAADDRSPETAVAGDLAQYPGHVMIYLGVPNTFVHAANPQSDVELWSASGDKAANLNYGDPTN